ncbi:unnamed protein product [Miscanthus lutarioriparius]|uniref:Uncharacterized protein n=1 Tax=Miscanthus lutarioriparius TaxID=422564 RepID=A0A811MXG4_9POAL|nr:unnamed protein product [Miscanthus lutarioriparius]
MEKIVQQCGRRNKGVSTSRSSKNLCTDPFVAETKEARCVKLLTENNSQECCKWYSGAGHLSQKWIPVDKKETCNGIYLDVSANGEDSNLPSERTYKLNSSEHVDLKFQADNATETDYSKMKEAISLCLLQTPDITLRTVWQWYEEPSCYGLDVKAQDLRRSKGLWNSHCQFTTYFVPYLSVVQLFSQPKRTSGGSIDKESNHRNVTCETSSDLA